MPIKYRYRDAITKAVEYFTGSAAPTLSLSNNPIQNNSLVAIEHIIDINSTVTGVTIIDVNLVENFYSTISNTLALGSYAITVVNKNAQEGAPSGKFSITKIKTSEYAQINEDTNVSADITGEYFELLWASNDNLKIKKRNVNSTPFLSTYDGLYTVKLI
jgi:hypothetical protein